MYIFISLIIYLWASLPLLKIIQIKDYFFPSIWAHFDYPSNWKVFFEKSEIILGLLWVILMFLAIIGISFPIYSTIWKSLSVILLIALFLKRKNFLKSFNWTTKFLFINILLFIFIVRIIQYSDASLLLIVFLLTKLGQFPIVLISTFITNFLTKIYARILYKKARQKIKKWKNSASVRAQPTRNSRKIIGIAGSYGKSSVKEFLSQLLSEKYRVLKSPLRLNSEIGLSQLILKNNLDDIDYLILEMGARAVGEIETMVNVLEPDIVYLTGIAPQHIGTFGSIENIIKAKSEMFSKNPDIAIFNNADEQVKKISETLSIVNKYFYGQNGNFYSENENCGINGSSFTFVYPDGKIDLKTNLIAPHQIENLLGALTGCYLLGINPRDLEYKIQNLELLPHSYQVISPREFDQMLVIDDSYNSNLIGIKKGAEYFLKLPIEQKIIIFNGMLEAGINVVDYYKEFIEIFKRADKILLTFKDYSDVLIKELSNVEIIDKEKFEKFHSKLQKENCGILILGRVPNWIFEILLDKSS